jgi:hypothetical protein
MIMKIAAAETDANSQFTKRIFFSATGDFFFFCGARPGVARIGADRFFFAGDFLATVFFGGVFFFETA